MNDVIIIGAGPAGLTAGMYCRLRRLSVLVLDAGRAGGQLRSVYAEKMVHDWPGRPAVVAADLADDLASHAEELGVPVVEGEKVLEVRSVGEGFAVVGRDSASGEERVHPAKAVIIAIGGGAVEPRRLGVPGEEALGEDSITYRLPAAERVAGRRVVVTGGGDSALESAQFARAAGAEVTIVHRGPVCRAMEANLEAIHRLGIECRRDMRVTALEVEDGALRAVLIQARDAGRPAPDDPPIERLPCDHLVVNIGTAANLEAVQAWGVEVDAGRIRVDCGMRTSVPGIFACGDIVVYEGKYKLLVSAASEGATAANSAYVFVRRPPAVTMKDLWT